jgi:hypothetical protein
MLPVDSSHLIGNECSISNPRGQFENRCAKMGRSGLKRFKNGLEELDRTGSQAWGNTGPVN